MRTIFPVSVCRRSESSNSGSPSSFTEPLLFSSSYVTSALSADELELALVGETIEPGDWDKSAAAAAAASLLRCSATSGPISSDRLDAELVGLQTEDEPFEPFEPLRAAGLAEPDVSRDREVVGSGV